MKTFSLKIFTAERPFFEGECASLIVPTTQGSYGIMAHHSPMVAALANGDLQYRPAENAPFEHVAVSSGIVTFRENEATVLVETAEKATDIDFARAIKQYEHAKKRLQNPPDDLARKLAEMKLSRAVTRMKIHSRQSK